VRSVLRQVEQGITIHVHVIPRAARDEICGLYGQALKVRLRAPPVEGAANSALLKLFAAVLDVSPRQLTIVSGQSSRDKRLSVAGLSYDAAEEKLAPFLHP